MEKNKDSDEFGNVTFGEATELLVDIIGQIVILEFIPKEEREAYKRSLERMYDGYGTYSKFATASSKSPQSYFAQFFKTILEEKYKVSPLAMILVDSFTWQLFYALTCTTTFEKPKKETARYLIRKELFYLIYNCLLNGESFSDGSVFKVSEDSISTFLGDTYDTIFLSAENDFKENGKVFISELKEYWEKNYKNVDKTDLLQEIINELLNDGGIFYKQINEIKISYKNNFDELKKERPKLYDLLCIDKNDKHFDNIFKKAIEEFIEYGTDKYLSIDSLIIDIPKSKNKYQYLYRYIDSGKIDPSKNDFNFDDNIQKMRKGNVFNPTWKTLKIILDFLLKNDKKSLISRLVGLYLRKNAQRALKEILDISEDDIIPKIDKKMKPEEFYNDNDFAFPEQFNLIFICLAYQHHLCIEKSNEIIAVIEDKFKNSKKFFSPWLKARTMVFENGESLKENKEEQDKIIAGYKKAYDDGVAYAGGYLAQFLLEAIVINIFFKPESKNNKNNNFYGYGYALELFDPKKKEELFNNIKESIDPRKEFINIHYSNFSPRGQIISQKYPNLHSISEFNKEARRINDKGLEFTKTGRFEQAKQCFSEAIMLDPLYINAYNNRGYVFKEMGENFIEYTLSDYNMALLLDPKHENTLFNRGLFFLSRRQFESAITDFTNLINIKPEDSEAHLQLNNAILLEKFYLLENRRKNTLTMLKLHDIFEREVDYGQR